MKGYDVSQGAFTTYSQPFIRHMINSQINFYTGSTVHYTKIQSLINDAIKMLQDKGMEPTVRKITTLTDLKPEIVRRELDCIANTTLQYIDSADTKDEEYGSMTSPEDVVIEQTKTAALQKRFLCWMRNPAMLSSGNSFIEKRFRRYQKICV